MELLRLLFSGEMVVFPRSAATVLFTSNQQRGCERL